MELTSGIPVATPRYRPLSSLAGTSLSSLSESPKFDLDDLFSPGKSERTAFEGPEAKGLLEAGYKVFRKSPEPGSGFTVESPMFHSYQLRKPGRN